MKIQRKIVALLCCLAFMETLSFDALSAQAAACSHEYCYTYFDVKTYYYKEDGHYGDWGPTHICSNCGYQYWEDSLLEYVKLEDHKYITFKLIEMTDTRHVYLADCETPECPHQSYYIYDIVN